MVKTICQWEALSKDMTRCETSRSVGRVVQVVKIINRTQILRRELARTLVSPVKNSRLSSPPMYVCRTVGISVTPSEITRPSLILHSPTQVDRQSRPPVIDTRLSSGRLCERGSARLFTSTTPELRPSPEAAERHRTP